MTELLRGFDAFTMAFMVAILYLSLSAVLVYTALCRRTYAGFGSMALAQVSWSVGLFLNYFRPFETLFSLYLGALLMQFYGVLLYRGLLLYGGVSPRRRLPLNYIAFAVVSAVQGITCLLILIHVRALLHFQQVWHFSFCVLP